MNNISPFGKIMRRIRQIRGLTQAEVAQKLELERSTITYWELGGAEPSLSNVLRLCQILKCTPNQLLGYNKKFAENLNIPVEKI